MRHPISSLVLAAATAVAAAGLAGCGSAASSGSAASTAGSGSDPGAAPTLTSADEWLTFGHAPSRVGAVANGPAPATARRRWKSPSLDGQVYAQPLVAGGLVIAATEGDTVYALRPGDGSIAWQRNLGRPVDGGSLPCGNIDPSGITGTPVVDTSTGTIYVVAFSRPAHHDLVALDLATGAERWRRVIDPPGLSATVEQERGALTIGHGRVYVPFGGLFGDCGPYKGAVVSSAVDGKGPLATWTVPADREGGIWAPAGPATDPSGDLLVSTGNTEPAGTFNEGNAVVRLTPDLNLVDDFAPSDFAHLSQQDLDLGSIAPLPVADGLVFVAGKDGNGYLLDGGHLGHAGGQVFAGRVCSGGAFGGAAWNPPNLVVGCSNGVVGLRVSGRRFEVAWTQPGGTGGAPAIAAGTAWVAQRRGHLLALDPSTGAVRADLSLGTGLVGFPSPSVTSSLVFVNGSKQILAYG